MNLQVSPKPRLSVQGYWFTHCRPRLCLRGYEGFLPRIGLPVWVSPYVVFFFWGGGGGWLVLGGVVLFESRFDGNFCLRLCRVCVGLPHYFWARHSLLFSALGNSLKGVI